MIRRYLLMAGAALTVAACSRPVEKKSAPVAAALSPPLPDTVTVRLQTSEGDIVLRLERKKAPITTANFLHYVDTGKLDGAHFWRALKVGTKQGFIQGAISTPPYAPIAHEPTTQTGLSHTDGAISLSRFAPGTATIDFTISVGDMTYLDAGGTGSADKLGYAAFGHVVEGMEVVKRILHDPVDRKRDEDGLEGQILKAPVTIIKASRVI
ncbi:peptidylprolyl isomerase [Asticcacaulis sp. 201]|uniref:peptidylprolyl isomerase n=1 Tax=Asticcacaulis sp. 201 TaxID=3028787 RepID=UPI002916A2E2|nr:peptidylprolyl isomerase [Asticcacaulis sp. 201]MDV6331262.1 peptidylprolyl isomerase [Asticcacaulis sp. 201]